MGPTGAADEEDEMVPGRLDVVTLVTRDVPALRDFYEGLGWRVAGPRRDDHVRLATQGATLSLWTADQAGPEVLDAVAALGHRPPAATLAVAVEGPAAVDAAIDAARAAGARVLAAPVDRPWGGRSGYFADPDGTAWEVVWIPGVSVDAGGGLRWPDHA
jgi:catechol 2,3-dioxygenase-like lactoylglutathione lyase family enzyme